MMSLMTSSGPKRKDVDFETRSGVKWPRHRCHIIVMVTRAKLIESPTPNFGPRTTKITPFAFRNRATPIPREP